MAVTLSVLQRIPTSGARAVEPLTVDGVELLAIPQLALDIVGEPATMNGGDSNTDMLLMRLVNGRYEPWSVVSAPGGEDAEFFTVGNQAFLAVASIRSGSGPYDFTTDSSILSWDGSNFITAQRVRSFAAKQWKHWTIGERHFLGLAQGVQLPGLEDENRASMVYEWDGGSFVQFQEIPSRWAYNWHPFVLDGTTFVAHAEHLDPSVLYRWDGQRLVPHQDLASRAGRAFATFTRDDEHYLVVACLQESSWLMKWDGSRFVNVQELAGLGARELAVIERGDRLFVVRVNFVLGTPAAPTTSMESLIYEFVEGGLRSVAAFPTTGGTDAAVTRHGPDLRLVISNSLSADVRFACDTVVYSVDVS